MERYCVLVCCIHYGPGKVLFYFFLAFKISLLSMYPNLHLCVPVYMYVFHELHSNYRYYYVENTSICMRPWLENIYPLYVILHIRSISFNFISLDNDLRSISLFGSEINICTENFVGCC